MLMLYIAAFPTNVCVEPGTIGVSSMWIQTGKKRYPDSTDPSAKNVEQALSQTIMNIS